MFVNILMVLFVVMVVCVFGFALYKTFHVPDQSPCPHDMCQHKLPYYGMKNSVGNFIPEQCPLCSNWVIWNVQQERYFRILPPEE